MKPTLLLPLAVLLLAQACDTPNAAPRGTRQLVTNGRFQLSCDAATDAPTRFTFAVRALQTNTFAPLVSGTNQSLAEAVLALRLNQVSAEFNRPPAVAGTYHASQRRLEFTPKLPLLPGEIYLVEFNGGALPGGARDWLTLRFGVPKPAAPPPRVTAIYPSGDALPANHLKFYLDFSEPMRQGEAFKHLKLVRADGTEVPDPWRDVELWSADGKRFTLWLHPGRQKTGVNLNVELGPCLVEGRRYTLVVAGDWKSQAGEPLGKNVEKKFLAGPPQRARLDLADWQLRLPKAGTRDPLRVTFPAPLDWALLHREVWIERADGARVAGHIVTVRGEREWSFTPEQPWARGAFRLVAATILEDLAGNSLARKFESEVGAAPPQPGPATAAKPFNL